MPVILATQETEIRRIMIQRQPEALSKKKNHRKGLLSVSRYRP
jgi:hypothetical protein